MVRRLLICILVLGFIAALLVACGGSDSKSYSADRFDVDLAVQPDGSLIVTETVDFRFEGGPFTYVFRDLAYNEIDGIDRLQASMDGAVLPQGTGPGQVQIEAGDPLKVTWHLPPTYDTAHSFGLVYRVQGALRQLDDADALIWRAVPEEHDYEIASSTVKLSYPPSAQLLSQPVVQGANATVEMGEGQAVLQVQNVGADEDVIVEARFAPGSLTSAPPAWQVAQAERVSQVRPAQVLGLGVGLLTVIVGGGLVIGYARRFRRPQAAQPAAPFKATEPPSPASPAVAAKLVPNGNPGLAAIFDLAQRGALSIEETAGRWGRSFTLHRQLAPGSLKPHEQGLIEALFTTKRGFEDELPLSQVATRLASHAKLFNEPLDEEMALAGLLDMQRQAQHKRLIAGAVMGTLLGAVGFGAGLILGAVAAENAQWAVLPVAAVLAGLGSGLFIVGLLGLIVTTTFSIWTEQGERAAADWKGFAAYLKDVSKGKDDLLDVTRFDRYLPYAAGFGLGEAWTKRYQQQSGFSVPPWFQALHADDSSAAFIAVMIASQSAFSSDGGASGGGGGGASGGGASGAG
ncbi:MAG TPA: DUF2207 domain-containing protein [Anaerolineae bacterium]|nr:DUF2207 domain-containing protein [Anaerolineae bacterium]